MDVSFVVAGFVLLVLIDIHLPDNSRIIDGQLLPQLILLPLFLLLGPVVLSDQLSSPLLNPGGRKE